MAMEGPSADVFSGADAGFGEREKKDRLISLLIDVTVEGSQGLRAKKESLRGGLPPLPLAYKAAVQAAMSLTDGF